MTQYSDDIKAQALAALLTGHSFTQVASMFGVPVGTLKSWKQRTNGDLDTVDASGSSTKRQVIGDLLIGYLEANLATIRSQVETFSDAEWLKKYSPSEAAILHGVLVDKSIRLLEGLADSGNESAMEDGSAA